MADKVTQACTRGGTGVELNCFCFIYTGQTVQRFPAAPLSQREDFPFSQEQI